MTIDKIYLIPGLGCDRRVFEKFISFLEVEPSITQHLEWLSPLSLSESIPNYAARIAKDLDKEEKNTIIIGLSLGGMVATELAKIIPYQKLFIISSIKHQSERPKILNLAKIVPLYHLTPTWFTQNMLPPLARWLKISDPESSYLFGKMLRTVPKGHIRWARHNAVHWFNSEMPQNCIHIHGTKDHIFTSPKMQVDYPIQNATHNMIMDRPAEIAAIVSKEIKNILA